MTFRKPSPGGHALKRNELEAKTVAELRSIARAAGLSIGSRRKSALIDEIIRGFRKKRAGIAPSAKSKGAPPARKPEAAARTRAKVKAGITKKTAAKKKAKSLTGALKKPTAPVKAKKKRPPAAPAAIKKARRPPAAPLKPVIAEEPPRGGGRVHVAPLTFVEAPQPPERNMATAIAVDPTRIFAYWELTEAAARRGAPAVRVHDVTGRKTGGRPRSTFDIRPEKKAGGLYVRVLPGREYIVEAGVFTPGGRFVAARRSRRVKTPPVSASGERAIISEEHFRFAPVSYWPS